MAECLTTNLRLELEKTNVAFARWVGKSGDWLSSTDAHFSQMMEESECTIAALNENERQLEEVRAQNDIIKGQQKAEVEHYLTQTERLKQQKKVLEQQLRKFEDEEAREAARLEKTRAEHDALRDKVERSLNDLTHGVRMYTALGLEFQKAQGDSMKFIFTQLDPKDPSRAFFFRMFVDEHDQYQLVETNPELEPSACTTLIQTLNSDNNIGRFVVNMRKSFAAIL